MMTHPSPPSWAHLTVPSKRQSLIERWTPVVLLHPSVYYGLTAILNAWTSHRPSCLAWRALGAALSYVHFLISYWGRWCGSRVMMRTNRRPAAFSRARARHRPLSLSDFLPLPLMHRHCGTARPRRSLSPWCYRITPCRPSWSSSISAACTRPSAARPSRCGSAMDFRAGTSSLTSP